MIFVAVVAPLNAPTVVFHAAARLVTFTEPSPVAMSYPAAVVKAGVVEPLAVTNTPFAAVWLLQVVVDAPAQGTEFVAGMVPVVVLFVTTS